MIVSKNKYEFVGTIYLFSLGSIRKTFANAPAGDRFKM
eukprot:COSAG02_NODE_40426_length_405_cov_2.973856_1_plen_37_part_01